MPPSPRKEPRRGASRRTRSALRVPPTTWPACTATGGGRRPVSRRTERGVFEARTGASRGREPHDVDAVSRLQGLPLGGLHDDGARLVAQVERLARPMVKDDAADADATTPLGLVPAPEHVPDGPRGLVERRRRRQLLHDQVARPGHEHRRAQELPVPVEARPGHSSHPQSGVDDGKPRRRLAGAVEHDDQHPAALGEQADLGSPAQSTEPPARFPRARCAGSRLRRWPGSKRKKPSASGKGARPDRHEPGLHHDGREAPGRGEPLDAHGVSGAHARGPGSRVATKSPSAASWTKSMAVRRIGVRHDGAQPHGIAPLRLAFRQARTSPTLVRTRRPGSRRETWKEGVPRACHLASSRTGPSLDASRGTRAPGTAPPR